MPRSNDRTDVPESLIAVRAYERWMGRGCPTSDGLDDWLAAREELQAELAAPKRSVQRKPSKAARQARGARN